MPDKAPDDMSKHRLLSIGLSVLLVIWIIHFATNHLPHMDVIKGHTVPATHGPSALIRALRPNYPYSVIAGGAYSPDELQYAHAADEVVRAHYAGFDVKHAKLVTLIDDRFQYVSYRLNDHIYWTKKRLRIPKGELLLTDGANYARTRCGNRLSDTAHPTATNAHEPDSAVLALPPVTPEMLPKMALANPPVLRGFSRSAITPLDLHTGTAHTGAALPPGQLETEVASVQPSLAAEPMLTGFAPVSPGSPALTTGGRVRIDTTKILPPSGSAVPPPAETTAVGTQPPVDVLPVPEPNTIYLFLVSLVISLLALLRMGPKDEPDR